MKEHDGQLQPDDALLYSPDGGATFVRVLSRRAKLLGFALSPDGETLLLGYGDPVLFAYTVEPEQTGWYRLRVADLLAAPDTAVDKLTKIFAGSVTCLRWTEHGLYACLAQAEQGFEAGRAADAEFSLADAQPFRPLLDLSSLTPLACAASSSAGVCPSALDNGWSAVCEKLGASCTATEPLATPAAASARGGVGCACYGAGYAKPQTPLLPNLSAILGLLGLSRGRRRRRRARPDINAACLDTSASGSPRL